MRRKLVGSFLGVAAAVALGTLMLPIRSHLAISTAALVLVIPVVAGVTVGGWPAGVVSVVAGFLVYDFVFLPPYYSLTVGEAQNWVALAVYVVVMAVVARLVSNLREAEEASQSRESTARGLLDLSELLLTESPNLAQTVVTTVQETFAVEGVALLQQIDDRLEIVASAGTPISAEELSRLRPESRLPVPLSTGGSFDRIQALALSSSRSPIGLLVLRNAPASRAVREALPVLANHLALALERSQLRDQAHRAELLEEIDHLRRALVGAVSHDLRTPLTTIKVASSTLVEAPEALSGDDLVELYSLIDSQADRLTRLVANLLDMTRIQSGALEIRRTPTAVEHLVSEAIDGLRSALGDRPVELVSSSGLPAANVDRLLIVQVLANLIDNANRLAPLGTPIVVEASVLPEGAISMAVMDQGPGVALGDRQSIFETFVRFDTGGRSGLGLAIAKAFVEAHGNRIWVEDSPRGGARFVFTLPMAGIASHAGRR